MSARPAPAAGARFGRRAPAPYDCGKL